MTREVRTRDLVSESVRLSPCWNSLWLSGPLSQPLPALIHLVTQNLTWGAICIFVLHDWAGEEPGHVTKVIRETEVLLCREARRRLEK